VDDRLPRLERALGYSFRDRGLLEQALTHRSCGARNNERLEFLGDAVLNQVVAESLFRQFPEAREGELSRMRAALVRGETLAAVARELDLGDHVRLGSGEMKSGGHRRDSILADCVEAVVGAMLLDGGIDVCRDRLLNWFSERLERRSPELSGKDPKTSLQEFLQRRGMQLPDYRLLAVEGKPHCRRFTVACAIPELSLFLEGGGSSRRKAEQAAARAALEAIDERG